MKPVIIGDCTLYQGDCLEIMPTLGKVDAVVTDPPYGVGMDGGNVGYKGFNNFEKLGWDKTPPSQQLLNMMLDSSDMQIIWGGNYFNLPPSRGFLIWDKGAGFKGRTYAECEFAWTSMDANARILKHDPLAKGDYKGKHHPTMKPLELMRWCVEKVDGTVLDPFMGSGTTGVACAKLGRKFVGIELEEKYFDIACGRIQKAYDQPDMFVEPPQKPTQDKLEF
tara:strand:+ start:81 stop:746 length:666 start_codon:yes stop_codon:yes gene_type:complete